MNNEISHLFISMEEDIISGLKKMDSTTRKLLIVVKEGKYIGLLSIGDIQRAIINNCKLTDLIGNIMRTDYVVASPAFTLEQIKDLMMKLRAEFMPVVDECANITNVYFWSDLFGQNDKEPKFKFDLPIVIMAGGFGSRMKPLTSVLPKPLIPINDKTFLEEIFERFSLHGSNTFHISVNYKADLIKFYLSSQNLPYKINYFTEAIPLGTAGSLSLLKNKIDKTFFVSNCDILVEQDYAEVLEYHKENGNEITLIAAVKNYDIPYGTIETGENGTLQKLIEKPNFNFLINSGMYILEPHLLQEIPDNKFFHITELIENIKKRQGKVGVFPVSEGSWKDIGQWNEYFSHIKSNFS